MQGKSILDDLVIEQNFAWVKLVLLDFLFSKGPFKQVRLRMHQTTDIISFYDLLSFLSKNDLECLVDDRRLFKVLKATNGTLQYNQAQLEDIQRPLCLKISRLRNRAFHEVLLRHVHFEDTKSH